MNLMKIGFFLLVSSSLFAQDNLISNGDFIYQTTTNSNSHSFARYPSGGRVYVDSWMLYKTINSSPTKEDAAYFTNTIPWYLTSTVIEAFEPFFYNIPQKSHIQISKPSPYQGVLYDRNLTYRGGLNLIQGKQYTISINAITASSYRTQSHVLALKPELKIELGIWDESSGTGVFTPNQVVYNSTIPYTSTLPSVRTNDWETIEVNFVASNDINSIRITPGDVTDLRISEVSLMLSCCKVSTLIQNTNQVASFTEVSDFIRLGRSVDVNRSVGDVVINQSFNIVLQAAREIIFEDGTNVSSNGEFSAKINECSKLSKPSITLPSTTLIQNRDNCFQIGVNSQSGTFYSWDFKSGAFNNNQLFSDYSLSSSGRGVSNPVFCPSVNLNRSNEYIRSSCDPFWCWNNEVWLTATNECGSTVAKTKLSTQGLSRLSSFDFSDSNKDYMLLISELNVFPNPARDVINFTYNVTRGNNVSVQLVNTLGSVVSTSKGSLSSASLNVSGVDAGMYIANVIVDGVIASSQTVVVE